MPSFNEKKSLVINMFGPDYLTARHGTELRYKCWFCESSGKTNNDYKLYVNINKLKFWCFRCESFGTLRSDDILLADNNSGVIDQLVDYLSIDDQKENDNYNKFVIPAKKLVPGELSYEYMISRGVSHDDIGFYDMREGDLFNKGLFGRVVMPNVVYNNVFTDMFSARAYLGQEMRHYNPPNSNKINIVYNLHRIEDNPPYIDLTEGTISSIIAGRHAVCSFGKYVSDRQMELILAKHPGFLNIALDPDATEQALKACDKAIRLGGLNVKLTKLPEGMDPADVGQDGFTYYRNSAIPYQSRLYFDLSNLCKSLSEESDNLELI